MGIATHNRLNKAKIDNDHQDNQFDLAGDATRITYQDISDLEEYALRT